MNSTLRVVAYDPHWPQAFEAEAARLRAALGVLALRIDHHGSTAVPGLRSKPIIDIQISVASLAPLGEYRERLGGIGYVHVPHPDDAFSPFFHKPSQWPHTHHVHLVKIGGAEERRTLAFRDFLRDHPATAREYERLKEELIERLGSDVTAHDTYAQGKTDFVERVIAAAFSAGYPVELPPPPK